MGLNYGTNIYEGENFTTFTLAEGTTFQLGSETVECATDIDVFIRGKALSRDAVVETICGAGQAAANAQYFAHKETRDGKEYAVSYGGRGQRIEEEIVPDPAEEVVEEKPKKKGTKAKPKG